jgi:hypothetical protein
MPVCHKVEEARRDGLQSLDIEIVLQRSQDLFGIPRGGEAIAVRI